MLEQFAGLPPRVRRWIDYEQTVNERLIDPARYAPIDPRSNTVRRELHPEQRGVWAQQAIWLRRASVRAYGPVRDELLTSLGVAPQGDRIPLLLHPQAPAAQRRLAQTHGVATLDCVSATPTASYRSVVAWTRRDRGVPVVLKLSLGAIVGRRQRRLSELNVAQAVLLSAVLDTIPAADRARLRLDWFREPCGAVEVGSRQGWLLRHLPKCLSAARSTTLLPLFSLISHDGDREPLLARWIRESGRRAEDFVIEQLLRPYVNAESYLLFEHGVQHEGHTQNVLLEVDADERMTGRIVLRDLSDTSVNIAFRMAKGRALPVFPSGFLPRRTPFAMAGNAGDHQTNFRRPRILRGFDTVERYGLGGCVWPINASLLRFFPRYDPHRVEHRYLELWQQAAIDALGVRPLFRKRPRGLATDEAIAYVLRETDWRRLGARPASLPDAAEPLLGEGRQRRTSGPAYQRLTSTWGDLFIANGLPAFFRSAF